MEEEYKMESKTFLFPRGLTIDVLGAGFNLTLHATEITMVTVPEKSWVNVFFYQDKEYTGNVGYYYGEKEAKIKIKMRLKMPRRPKWITT